MTVRLERIIIIVLAVMLFSVWQVYAGTPAGPGTSPDSTSSYTLEDIYARLDAGTAGSESMFTEPSVAPGTGTMHTLNEIMAKVPAKDDTSGALTTEVLTGKTFWGLNAGSSQWGLQTGSMTNNGAVTITPATSNQTIAAGYHNGSGTVTGDSDLTAGNIKSGANIFGVDGSVIEATGNAAVGDVLSDKTFSNASSTGLTGSMTNNGTVTITATTSNQTIAAGYHNGSGTVTGDNDLAAANIKKDVEIFDVMGTYEGGGGSSTYAAGVPKTGQTTSYATGDDGDLELGVDWPNPRFTDNSDGTVTDNLTGLIWLKNANCANEKKKWSDALTFANTLFDGSNDHNSGDCGLSDGSNAGDWRLPNVRELQSLIDYGQSNRALPSGHPFTGVQSTNYWSSSTYAGSTSFGWVVDLVFGLVLNGDLAYGRYVWPVRGGQ